MPRGVQNKRLDVVCKGFSFQDTGHTRFDARYFSRGEARGVERPGSTKTSAQSGLVRSSGRRLSGHVLDRQDANNRVSGESSDPEYEEGHPPLHGPGRPRAVRLAAPLLSVSSRRGQPGRSGQSPT